MRMAVPVCLLLALLAPRCLADEERDVVIDRCEDVPVWSVNPGWEFPGAAGAVALGEDAEGGRCVRLTYDFTEGGNYVTASRPIAIPQASEVTFRIRQEGANYGLVRIADATGQEHAAGFAIEGEGWQSVRLPLDVATFSGYWSGAKDGQFHFPLRTIIIGVSRGPTVRGACLIDNLGFRTSDASLAYRATMSTGDPGNVAFISRAGVPLRVRIESGLAEPSQLTLRVTGENWHRDRVELLRTEVALTGLGEVEAEATLPSAEPEYWSLTAELLRGEEPIARMEGSAVIVERPRNFGVDDPASFFAIQQTTDGARTERLGVKWVRAGRDWRWGEIQRGRYWLPDVAGIRANHQLVMYTMTAYPPEWATVLAGDRDFWAGEGSEERRAMWGAFVEYSARALAADVDTFEIQNEPDLTCMWQDGLDFAHGIDRYTRILETGAEAVRRGAPGARVAGIDVSGGDYDAGLPFSRTMMERCGGLIDVYTGHPYAGVRYFGEGLQPMWPVRNEEARKCRDTLAMIAEHGGTQRFWIGEKGWGLDVTEGPLSAYSRDFAACIVQSMALAHSVPGVERYYYFLEEGCNEGGYEYGLFRAGLPLPAALAYSTLAGKLHHARPFASPDLGSAVQAHLFVSDETGLATLVAWSEEGDSILTLPSSPVAWRRYDLMGRTTGMGEAGRPLALTLTRSPAYLQCPVRGAKALAEALPGATLSVAEPVRLEAAYVSDTSTVSVRLRNVTARPVPAVVEALGASATVEVAADSATTVALTPEGGLLPLNGGEARVRVTVAGVTREAAAPVDLVPVRAEGPWMTDSREQPTPLAVLDQRGQVLPSDPGIGWSGPDDLSARVWCHWTPEALVLEVAAADDAHVAPSDDPGGFWGGDSVQIAIDPLNDGGGAGGFEPDDREYGLVLGSNGLRVVETYPERRSLDFPATAQQLGPTLISYRVSIPWAALGLTPRPGLVLGLNAIVNDNDGTGRGYWIGITPGIGEGKRPSVYRDVYLTE